MRGRNTLFQANPIQENYNKIKALFIILLHQTEKRCIKICDNKYDQERNYYMSYLPAVEEDRHKAIQAAARIRAQLKMIDDCNRGSPAGAMRDLLAYGMGLSDCYFKNLFMSIFSAKLRKRWVPIINHATMTETNSEPNHDQSCSDTTLLQPKR